ncbi:MAG: NADPH-dependent 7-cyano-7-deazaguanine reductase QueF [Acidobacteria bacterium]|nr:NADPH-dependent 7-cyano-7-deazaguanine reductase QueF [Acidobacteriota bacterium]
MARKKQKVYTDEHAAAGLDVKLPEIECWPNQFNTGKYWIEITTPEFTSVCPRTGLPDHGTVTIRYVPAKDCLELKALKMYMLAYRNIGIFQENVVNRVLNDCVKACQPHEMTVTGEFTPRGGVYSTITASYTRKGR